MDADRFDTLLRSLSATPSRRGLGHALTGLGLGGALGVLGLAEGGQGKKKRRRRKKRRRKAFCAGKNNCVAEALCQRSGPDCFCFVNAETGKPFCGLSAESTTDCLNTPCGVGETCVDVTECDLLFDTACAVPCPNPL